MASTLTYKVIFYLGLLALVATLPAAVGTLQYQFVASDEKPETMSEMEVEELAYEYEELSAEEQRIVDQAMAGGTDAYTDREPLPGNETGTAVVRKDGIIVFVRPRTVVNVQSTWGYVTGGLLLFGVVAVAKTAKRVQRAGAG